MRTLSKKMVVLLWLRKRSNEQASPITPKTKEEAEHVSLLKKLGLLDETLYMTKKASILMARLNALEKDFRIGIPVNERKGKTTIADWKSLKWIKVRLSDKGPHYLYTRGFVMKRGSVSGLGASVGSQDTASRLRKIFRKHNTEPGGKNRLYQTMYQRRAYDSYGIVWLVSEDKKTRLPIDERFYDMLMERTRGQAKFYGIGEIAHGTQIHVKIQGENKHFLIGMVAPIDPKKALGE